jgi:hypothetical protein
VAATEKLTLGGLLLALIILVCNLYPWYRGGRQLSKLAAFGKGLSGGVCAAMCPGGILGWAHSRSGTVGNGVGERTGTALTGPRRWAGEHRTTARPRMLGLRRRCQRLDARRNGHGWRWRP